MEALLNSGDHSAVPEQRGVNKQLAYLNEINRFSIEELRRLDGLDGKVDGKISLELSAGSMKMNIRLEYDENGNIYLAMKDGSKVKLEENSIIAVNFEKGLVTVIKPTKDMTTAERVHSLMKGGGWSAYIIGKDENGKLGLYHASLNPEYAISQSNKYSVATLEGNKITSGITVKRKELPGYTDYRRSEWESWNNTQNNTAQNPTTQNKGNRSKTQEVLKALKEFSVRNANLLAIIYEKYQEHISVEDYARLAKEHFTSSNDFTKSLSNFLLELENLAKKSKEIPKSNQDPYGAAGLALGLNASETQSQQFNDQSNQIPNNPYGSGLGLGVRASEHQELKFLSPSGSSNSLGSNLGESPASSRGLETSKNQTQQPLKNNTNPSSQQIQRLGQENTPLVSNLNNTENLLNFKPKTHQRVEMV